MSASAHKRRTGGPRAGSIARGQITVIPDACKSEDKSGVALAAKTYVGPAGNCTVMWVSETPGPQGAIYSARLRCPSERTQQQEWPETNLVIRPDDTNKISAGPDFSSLKTYQRCP